MSWQSLSAEIAEMFEGLSVFEEILFQDRRRSYSTWNAVRGPWYIMQLERKKTERAMAREAKASTRPPCPRCGQPVTRCGATAKIPKYCSDACMRATRWARWHAKHGATRNERRRVAA